MASASAKAVNIHRKHDESEEEKHVGIENKMKIMSSSKKISVIEMAKMKKQLAKLWRNQRRRRMA
jgi:hypothetical protein